MVRELQREVRAQGVLLGRVVVLAGAPLLGGRLPALAALRAFSCLFLPLYFCKQNYNLSNVRGKAESPT